jgi:hypothetical protein
LTIKSNLGDRAAGDIIYPVLHLGWQTVLPSDCPNDHFH